jgi:hypothetical protein
MPMILRFGLLMESVSSCIFLSKTWVVWLIALQFLILFPFCLQVLRFCLQLILVCWSGLPLCLCFCFILFFWGFSISWVTLMFI